MRICVAFLLVLLFLSCVPVQAEINPSVDTKPFFCRYILTDWTPLCPTVGTGGAGSGNIFVTSDNSTYYYNTTTNETTIYGNTTSFFNTTIGNNLTTFSNYTYWYIINITYSEMNQTPNMTAGPQGIPGIQGEIGPEGPMNQTPNMTANMTTNMTANMTAGPQGEKGETGDTGAQGPAGPAGADGAANMTAGPPGEKGEKGDKGDKGDTGDTGPMNMTPNMTAGSQGPAGLDANVSSMWPVSSVYGTTNSSADPATLLGVGTWASVYNISSIITYRSFSPTQTSNTAPAGNSTTASSAYSGSYAAWYASNGITTTTNRWASSTTGAPWWWQVNLSASHACNNYTIYSGETTGDNPKNFMLNASADGVSWVTLDTRTNVAWPTTAQQSFPFSNTNSYPYYRIVITATPGGGTVASMAEVVLYETASATKAVYYWERTA